MPLAMADEAAVERGGGWDGEEEEDGSHDGDGDLGRRGEGWQRETSEIEKDGRPENADGDEGLDLGTEDDEDDSDEEDDGEESDEDEEEEDEESDEDEEEEDEDLANAFVKSIASHLRCIDSKDSRSVKEERKRRQGGVLSLTNDFSGRGQFNEGEDAICCWSPDTGIRLAGRKEREAGAQRLPGVAVIDRRGGGGKGIEREKGKERESAVAVMRNARDACSLLEESMSNSVDVQLDPMLEKRFTVPPPDPKNERKMALKNAPKTAGSKWFDLPAPQLTPELKRELQVIRLRGVVDPKRHYKAMDKKEPLPTYFQIGRVIEGPTEFYSSRLTKSQRKQTIAEEILADEAVAAFRKRKYQQIEKVRMAGGRDQYKNKFLKRKKAWARV